MIVTNVARGMVVYPKVIESYVMAELPFMATEEILMAGVRRGGDRQELHELVRRHSMDAAREVKQNGKPNDLLERLAGDKAFAGLDLRSVLNPSQFVGRAPQQVEGFVEQVVAPIRKRYAKELGQGVELKV
jgi:adenylosuccinate lyase